MSVDIATTDPDTLYTFSGAGRELGIDRQTVALLVKQLGIEPRPVPWNGKAKGLTPDDLRRIKRSWDRLGRTA